MKKVTINYEEDQIIEIITLNGSRVFITKDTLWRLCIFQNGFNEILEYQEMNSGIEYFQGEAAGLYDALIYCQDHGVYNDEKIFKLMDVVRSIRENLEYFRIPNNIEKL